MGYQSRLTCYDGHGNQFQQTDWSRPGAISLEAMVAQLRMRGHKPRPTDGGYALIQNKEVGGERVTYVTDYRESSA